MFGALAYNQNKVDSEEAKVLFSNRMLLSENGSLRGLARVMDFMRAVSILFVGINVYWFCYSTLKEWGVTFEVIDKILWNFQRTTGLFSSVLWTKLLRWCSSPCRALELRA